MIHRRDRASEPENKERRPRRDPQCVRPRIGGMIIDAAQSETCKDGEPGGAADESGAPPCQPIRKSAKAHYQNRRNALYDIPTSLTCAARLVASSNRRKRGPGARRRRTGRSRCVTTKAVTISSTQKPEGSGTSHRRVIHAANAKSRSADHNRRWPVCSIGSVYL